VTLSPRLKVLSVGLGLVLGWAVLGDGDKPFERSDATGFSDEESELFAHDPVFPRLARESASDLPPAVQRLPMRRRRPRQLLEPPAKTTRPEPREAQRPAGLEAPVDEPVVATAPPPKRPAALPALEPGAGPLHARPPLSRLVVSAPQDTASPAPEPVDTKPVSPAPSPGRAVKPLPARDRPSLTRPTAVTPQPAPIRDDPLAIGFGTAPDAQEIVETAIAIPTGPKAPPEAAGDEDAAVPGHIIAAAALEDVSASLPIHGRARGRTGVTAIPEPTTAALLACGLAALASGARLRRSSPRRSP